MKTSKWFLLLLAVCLVFSLAACGGGGGDDSDTPVTPWLCFKANEDNCSISTTVSGSLAATPSLEYSIDGRKWVPFIIDSTIVDLINADDKVYIRATSSNASFSADVGWISFKTIGSVSASGNIMSLLDKNCSGCSVPEYVFRYLFSGTTLTTAPALPATTLAWWCYENMFLNCSSLTAAPKLPATTLAEDCYWSMFRNCSSLTTAPELRATTLANGCYISMFSGCSSLTTAPELRATTLANNCYSSMFSGCSSLTTAPELPATTLANGCYSGMFFDCSVLATAPELWATTLANNCYDSMFSGCSNLENITVHFTDWNDAEYATWLWVEDVTPSGEFHCRAGLDTDTSSIDRVPVGWTVIKDVPEPAP